MNVARTFHSNRLARFAVRVVFARTNDFEFSEIQVAVSRKDAKDRKAL